MPTYINKSLLVGIQNFFEKNIQSKELHPFLKQASFNAAVDESSKLKCSQEFSQAVANPLLIAVMSYYLGGPIEMANWRGYRTEPRDPLRYRAWEFHHDQKGHEVKIMILLTDVDSVPAIKCMDTWKL